ncbi:hypothetical protein LVD17_27145 [Fulvivirga ulvae]|uniref:hypothetical protein n=1 Tax=Fulvivirga ulvae TaxID=2904245 RepID=UPI001F2CBF46|nr:hypothetical protein [Fulvivirga ulvae]UII31968.1 hypothetical protein LVD17_27145 [Fulvivirga ulvae]
MMKIFDYIFYRVYNFYARKDKNPDTYASGIVSVVQFFTLLSLLAAIRLVHEFPIPGKYIVILVILVLMVVNWFRYEKSENYKQFSERWEGKERAKRRKRGWFIILYLIGVILFPIGIGILKHNLGVL